MWCINGWCWLAEFRNLVITVISHSMVCSRSIHIHIYYICTQYSNNLYNIITGSISTLVCNGQGCHLFTLKQHKGTTQNRHSELLVGGALMHVECVMLRVFSTVGLQRLFDYSHKKAKQQISMLLHSHFATTSTMSCVKKQTTWTSTIFITKRIPTFPWYYHMYN